MKRTIGASTLELLLLGLLDQNPSSGYDLRRAFVISPLRHYSDSPGTIYPALRRLAVRGWIDAQEPIGSRKRQVFKINREGRWAFISWLKRPLAPDDVLHPELIQLRFAFMGQALTRNEVKDFLGDFENKLEVLLNSLETFFAKNGDSFPLTGRLSFEYGLTEYRTRLRWARDARRVIAHSTKWPLS